MYINENTKNKQEVNVMTFPNKDAISRMLIHTKPQEFTNENNKPKSPTKMNLFNLVLAVLLSDSGIDAELLTLIALLI